MRSFYRTHSEPIAIKVDAPENSLAAAARQAVTASLGAEFRLDPLFSPEISKLISFAGSVAIRHGPLIERAIGEALKGQGLEVLRNVAIPVTRGALALVESSEYSQHAERQIDFNDNDIADQVDADILAVDEKKGCAGAFSVKRGGGAAGTKRRSNDVRMLRALKFTLASWLRRQGFRSVDVATVAVIDYLGQAGFPKDITIGRNELDDFFQAQIVAEVDAMTQAMRTAIDAEIRRLLEPIVRTMAPPAEKPKAALRQRHSARPLMPRMIRPRWGGEMQTPARTFVAGDRGS
jgi:hypothetical protein